MLRDTKLIFWKEWNSFKASDRSTFIVFSIIILIYSTLFTAHGATASSNAELLWWMFFSFLLCNILGNTLFVSERMTGSFEILLTCGLNRSAILLGKYFYMVLMVLALGTIPTIIATGFNYFLLNRGDCSFMGSIPLTGIAIFAITTLYSSAMTALVSLGMKNPRTSGFLGMLALLLPSTIFIASGYSLLITTVVTCSMGILLLGIAIRIMQGERILQPLNL